MTLNRNARIRVTVYSTFRLPQNVKKTFVLATKSPWLGGRNMPLAYAYLTSAAFCMIFALFFSYYHIKFKRKIGDVSDLNQAWSNASFSKKK